MNSFAIGFLIINGALLLIIPRRWAALPLLLCACYMTLGQDFTIGPFNFTLIRLLILLGFGRVVLRQEKLSGGMTLIDWLMVSWAMAAIASAPFHIDPTAALINRLGLVYNSLGIYFLLRVFCQSLGDIARLCCFTAILLVPVAIEMVLEVTTQQNLFSALGNVRETPYIRAGRVRAQGPFAHAILAGTVGAVSLPLVVSLWYRYRSITIAGIIACLAMVITSASSGPILSLAVAIGALFLWPLRNRMRLIQSFAVLTYIGLAIVMKAPVYYLMARIDLTGGSTGYHRAALIDSALKHFPEWWLAGTDYTRHWMPTGVTWSSDHTDITNHYLHLAVIGGLPLMLLFIAILTRGFFIVGKCIKEQDLPRESQFLIWSLGCCLFSHAVTLISVSYFDQSFVFLFLTLAAIGSAWKPKTIAEEADALRGDGTGKSAQRGSIRKPTGNTRPRPFSQNPTAPSSWGQGPLQFTGPSAPRREA